MDTYHIHFERSGGFAGITQTLDLKSDTLSTEDQKNLNTLIDSCDFFSLQQKSDLGSPDQFIYKISIKTKDKENVFTTGDVGMPDKVRPLIEFLSVKMRSR